MEYLSTFAEQLLPVIGALLAAFVVNLVRIAIKGIESKFDVDLDDRLEARALEIVRSGVSYAEQWAVNKTKSEGEKPSGAKKLEEALVFIRNEAERAGLEAWVDSKGEDLAKIVEGQIRKVL